MGLCVVSRTLGLQRIDGCRSQPREQEKAFACGGRNRRGRWGGAGAAGNRWVPTDSPDHWRRRDFTAGRCGSFMGSHRRTPPPPPPAKQPLTATPKIVLVSTQAPIFGFLKGSGFEVWGVEKGFNKFRVAGFQRGLGPVHLQYHYGVRSQKTILLMVLGDLVHSSGTHGPSWLGLLKG